MNLLKANGGLFGFPMLAFGRDKNWRDVINHVVPPAFANKQTFPELAAVGKGKFLFVFSVNISGGALSERA